MGTEWDLISPSKPLISLGGKNLSKKLMIILHLKRLHYKVSSKQRHSSSSNGKDSKQAQYSTQHKTTMAAKKNG